MENRESPVSGTCANPNGAVTEALHRLRSLHEGDLGVLDAVAIGERAIAPLRAIVVEREPSGLYETRRRAVEAMQRLGAFDDLLECLTVFASREITDPVEQTGEDAVLNAIARALSGKALAAARPLLLDLARARRLAGVIDALGALGCHEALPYFIEALADDFTRSAAENAIRTIGTPARSALSETVICHRLPEGREYESRTRQRLSALTLLAELERSRETVSIIEALKQDKTPAIASLAEEIAAGLPHD